MEINLSSEEFVDKLKARDESSITLLVNKYNKALYRAALGQGLAEDQVDEVLQATWDAFFSGIDRFQNRSHIRTYLFGILYNKIKEHWRYQKRFVDIVQDSSNNSDAISENQFDDNNQWLYEPIGPERFMEATETMELIQECMKGLTEQQRMAFYLREVQGEDTETICNILSVSNTNLRVLIYRGKNRLRKCLEGWFDYRKKS